MQKIDKKVYAIILNIIIFLSIISAVSATSINTDDLNNNSLNTLKKIVTLYKYRQDGSIEKVKVEIQYIIGEDINQKIEEKCSELLKNDPDLQKLLEDNVTKNNFCIIKSRGRGLHIKLNPGLPKFISSNIHIPIIYCRYPRDPIAYTTIVPLFNTNSTNTTTGPHSVLCIGFIGYKWWLGHISWRGFLLRVGFVGFSTYTKINTI